MDNLEQQLRRESSLREKAEKELCDLKSRLRVFCVDKIVTKEEIILRRAGDVIQIAKRDSASEFARHFMDSGIIKTEIHESKYHFDRCQKRITSIITVLMPEGYEDGK